jgi:glycosyltransferase involved in cell wall biosynthesis
MAAAVPVVATRVCGTDEVVVDGATGRLVPPADTAALADAILDVLDHPERARSWGEVGRTRFRERFTAARMADETARVYEECLAGLGQAAEERSSPVAR